MFGRRKEVKQEIVTVNPDDIPDGLFIVKKGILVYINKRAPEIFGYTREAMMGMDFSDYAISDEACIVRGVRVSRMMKGRTPDSFQYEIKTSTGVKKNIALAMSFLDADTVYITARDVSERSALESALEEISLRFRELVEMLPQVVYETDLSLRLTFVNENGFTMFGYTREDFLRGVYIKELLPFEEWNRAFGNITHVMAGMHTVGKEYIARRKDGSLFSIELFSAPLVRNGAIAGMRGIVIDRTDKKRCEAEFEHLRLSMLDVLNNENYGIVIVDNDEKRVLVGNKKAREIMNHMKDWGVPVYLADYFPRMKMYRPDGSVYQADDTPIMRGIHGENISSEIVRLAHPDRGDVWIDVNVTSVSDSKGKRCTTVFKFVETSAP